MLFKLLVGTAATIALLTSGCKPRTYNAAIKEQNTEASDLENRKNYYNSRIDKIKKIVNNKPPIIIKSYKIDAMQSKDGSSNPIKTEAIKFINGELLSLDITLEQAGYLNMIYAGSDFSLNIAFPIKFHPDNIVDAGIFSYPSKEFTAPAGEPFGKDTLFVFLSNKKLNLYENSLERIASLGLFEDIIDNEKNIVQAGMITLQTCATKEKCE